MAVESIKNNTAVTATEKPKKEKSVHIETIKTAALDRNTAVNGVQGSTAKNDRENESGEEKKEGQAKKKQVEAAVHRANSQFRKLGCEFSYHEAINRISIKVIDKETNEVIREIPPEETLEMVEKMWEMAGIIVDEKG